MGRLALPVRHLVGVDPAMAALCARIGPCRLEVRRQEPYQALLRAIAHQQLHGQAARMILRRLAALASDACRAAAADVQGEAESEVLPSPSRLLALEDAALRGCGFSGSKMAALRDIARHAEAGVVPSRRAAARLSDAALIERLTVIRGVGRWTVEMLLMFTLGRPDVLPVDDFGVREGFRRLHGLEAQPTPKALARHGEAWAPYRSTAAWYLWRAADEGKTIKQSV